MSVLVTKKQLALLSTLKLRSSFENDSLRHFQKIKKRKKSKSLNLIDLLKRKKETEQKALEQRNIELLKQVDAACSEKNDIVSSAKEMTLKLYQIKRCFKKAKQRIKSDA